MQGGNGASRLVAALRRFQHPAHPGCSACPVALQQRTSLTRLIEEGLQLRLRAEADTAKRRRVRLPVFKGRGGLVAGVSPLSNQALLEALGDDA